MIQTTIVLLLAGGLAKTLTRRSSAAERHVLWAAALAVAALLPLASAVLAIWQPAWARTVADLLPPIVRQSPPAVSTTGADIVIRAGDLEGSGVTLVRVAAMAWMLGAVLAFGVLLAGARRLARLSRQAQPISCASCLDLIAALSRELRIRRPVTLLESPMVPVPITWGVWRPRIVLPSEAASWPFDLQRAVLAHELAHVRRGDWLILLLAAVVRAVYWFHPLFWFAHRQLRNESEHACDDEVVGVGVEAEDYAEHLLQVVRRARGKSGQWRSALAMARATDLERRFEALLAAARHRRRVGARGVSIAAVVAAALTVPLAAAGLAPLMEATVHVQPGSLPAALDTLLASNAPAPLPVQRLRAAAVSAPGVIIAPPEVAEYTTPPLYSDEARRLGIEGVVTIEARIGVDGRAAAPRVIRGLGFGLDQNALVALRQWRFHPGTSNGQPFEMTAEMDIEFNLRNEALNELIANDMATRLGSDVVAPRIISTVNVPAADAGDERRTGTVALDIVLLEDGRPKIVRVLRSLTRSLDERAIEAFEQWRFTPALKSGRPVKVRLQADITFR